MIILMKMVQERIEIFNCLKILYLKSKKTLTVIVSFFLNVEDDAGEI